MLKKTKLLWPLLIKGQSKWEIYLAFHKNLKKNTRFHMTLLDRFKDFFDFCSLPRLCELYFTHKGVKKLTLNCTLGSFFCEMFSNILTFKNWISQSWSNDKSKDQENSFHDVLLCVAILLLVCYGLFSSRYINVIQYLPN